MAAEARPDIAAIVPAFNAAATLAPCLKALRALQPPPDEIIVYDDGSSDETSVIARYHGVTLIRNDGAPRGPAAGRNAGALATRADLLLFIDADVVIAPTALGRLMKGMSDAGAVAAFGSYDDRPSSVRTAALYGNLRHHFVHQNNAGPASTFWSGIGLIRRDLFLEFGGFDTSYARPSIEDVELGIRLNAAHHRIMLVADATGTHSKDWTLARLWWTDIVLRAIPWSALIADGRTAGVDLNLSGQERVSALVAHLLLWLLVGALFLPWLGIPATGAAAAYIALNRRFFALLLRRMPPLKVVPAMLLHWCYHLYASTTFALMLIATRLGLRTARKRRSPLSAGIRPDC